VQQFYHGVLFPIFGKFALFSQSFFQIPIVGEGPDVYSSAHAAGCAENILMAESKV